MAQGPYGLSKQVDLAGFLVDEPQAFQDALETLRFGSPAAAGGHVENASNRDMKGDGPGR